MPIEETLDFKGLLTRWGEDYLSREVRVNLEDRWFCGLSVEDKVPDHSVFSRARNERFRDNDILARRLVSVSGA
jgi:hypothetical protein